MTEVENKLDEIISRLNVLVKLMAMNLINIFDTNKDKIEFLSNMGFSSSEIITITEIPRQTVYNITSQLRKEYRSG